MADGAIIIDTKLRTKQAVNELSAMEKQLKKAESTLASQKQRVEATTNAYNKQKKAVEELAAKQKELTDKANAQRAGINKSQRTIVDAQNPNGNVTPQQFIDAKAALPKQMEEFAATEKELNAVNAQLVKEDEKLADINSKLKQQTALQTQAEQTIAVQNQRIAAQQERVKRANAGRSLAEGFKTARKPIDMVGQKLKMLAKRILLFALLTKALQGIKQYFSAAMISNEEFQAALASLRGALRTAFQPIMDFVIPALVKLITLLAQAAAAFAQFMATLFGKSIATTKASAEALYDESKALEATGGAAGGAGKQMASFDEINQIGDQGGGGGGATGKPVDFDIDDGGMFDKLQKIADYVAAIGLGLGAWKIASHFTKDLSKIAGIAMTAAGSFLFLKGAIDAWKNGTDWKNVIEMITGATLAVGGLTMAFSPLVGGIAGLVAGVSMLVIGIREWINTGELTWETATLIAAGIALIGVSIGLITGNWIPALIGAVAGLCFLIIAKWDDVKAFLKETWDKIKTWALECWDGIKQVWQTVADWFNEHVIQPIVDFFAPIVEWISAFFKDCWLIIQAVWIVASTWFNENVIQPLWNCFSPFFTDLWGVVQTTWENIKTLFQFLVNDFFLKEVIEPLGEMFNGLWDGIKKAAVSAFNFIMEKIEAFINHIIDSINDFCAKINSVAQWAGDIVGKDWSIIPTINHVSLPRLAEGAVIPANHEFAAILGDQKSGTNIETPLSTMVQAFKQAMGETGANRTIVFEIDKRQFAKITFDMFNLEDKRVGVTL